MIADRRSLVKSRVGYLASPRKVRLDPCMLRKLILAPFPEMPCYTVEIVYGGSEVNQSVKFGGRV
jgi:hypothetical protein